MYTIVCGRPYVVETNACYTPNPESVHVMFEYLYTTLHSQRQIEPLQMKDLHEKPFRDWLFRRDTAASW